MEINTEKIAKYALKGLQEAGASDVVITTSSGKVQQIKFVDNQVISTNDYQKTGTELFASFNKRIISANLQEYTTENIGKTIAHMKKVAQHVLPKEDYNGIAHGSFKYMKKKFDSAIKNPGLSGVQICEESVKEALGAGAKRVAGQLQLDYRTISLLTSGNVDVTADFSSAYFSIRAFTDKEASGAKTACSVYLDKLDAVDASRKAGELAAKAINPKQGKPGKYDVIFGPLPFAAFLNSIGHAASIFSVESGSSFFEGKIGKKVAGENITILDDPTHPESIGSTPADAEGVPAKKTAIIEKGVLKNFLHNSSTAKKYGVQNTANAGLVAPRPWNIVLQRGNKSFDEMVSEVKNGMWITNLWYTRFQNYLTGEFSTIPRDAIFLIENGKITTPIVNIRVTDSFLRLLQNIAALGKDVQQIKSWEAEVPTFTPSLLVKDVEITAPMK